MALKATIFKADLQVADIDRAYYGDHAVTIARHPSETDERMMVRLLAYALHAGEGLAFGGGVSDEDEPALWVRDLTGAVRAWIEVGLPDEKRVRRACGRADEVFIYSYGRGAMKWWRDTGEALARSTNLAVAELAEAETRALAALAQRNMKLGITIQDGQVLVSDGRETAQLEFAWRLRPGGG